MAKGRRFEGFVQFPWALPVALDALGLRERIEIDSRRAWLTFPALEGEFPSSQLVCPLDARGRGLRGDVGSVASWGFQSTSALCYVTAARTSLFIDGDLTTSVDVAYAFRPLFESFRLWAESWLRSPLDAGGVANDSRLYLARRRDPMTSLGLSPTVIVVRDEGLSGAQVRGALRRASRGQLPPVEQTLLASGRRALFAGDTRRVVIEAGSAAEVAMSSYITRSLSSRNLPEGFVERVTTNANGLVGLHRLCVSLGWEPVVSKTRLGAELAEVRNHAAHRGEVPGRDTATTALDHAAAVVDSLSPMPPC